MTQVQLKIEEFFDNKIAIEYYPNAKDIFDGKYNCIFFAMSNLFENGHGEHKGINIFTLKPNESRETIIQALLEYQKTLLPKIIGKVFKHSSGDIFVFPSDDGKRKFYDAGTRIITIYNFKESTDAKTNE